MIQPQNKFHILFKGARVGRENQRSAMVFLRRASFRNNPYIVQVRVADIRLYKAVGERHRRHFVTIQQNQWLSPDSGVTPGPNSAHPRSPSPP